MSDVKYTAEDIQLGTGEEDMTNILGSPIIHEEQLDK